MSIREITWNWKLKRIETARQAIKRSHRTSLGDRSARESDRSPQIERTGCMCWLLWNCDLTVGWKCVHYYYYCHYMKYTTNLAVFNKQQHSDSADCDKANPVRTQSMDCGRLPKSNGWVLTCIKTHLWQNFHEDKVSFFRDMSQIVEKCPISQCCRYICGKLFMNIQLVVFTWSC